MQVIKYLWETVFLRMIFVHWINGFSSLSYFLSDFGVIFRSVSYNSQSNCNITPAYPITVIHTAKAKWQHNIYKILIYEWVSEWCTKQSKEEITIILKKMKFESVTAPFLFALFQSIFVIEARGPQQVSIKSNSAFMSICTCTKYGRA